MGLAAGLQPEAVTTGAKPVTVLVRATSCPRWGIPLSRQGFRPLRPGSWILDMAPTARDIGLRTLGYGIRYFAVHISHLTSALGFLPWVFLLGCTSTLLRQTSFASIGYSSVHKKKESRCGWSGGPIPVQGRRPIRHYLPLPNSYAWRYPTCIWGSCGPFWLRSISRVMPSMTRVSRRSQPALLGRNWRCCPRPNRREGTVVVG